MIKIFTLLALMFSLSQARMIGGVSMTVDNEPITLTEIAQFQQANRASKEDAVNGLIQRKLEEQAIREKGIVISPYDVDKAAEGFAKENGVDMSGLEAGLKKQGKSLGVFKKEIGDKLKREKLYKKILGSRLKKADEKEIKAYYDGHKESFKMPGDIEVIEYRAKEGKDLQMLIMAPMMNHPTVKMEEKVIEASKVNPKLYGLLLQTPETKFTQIINTGEAFVTFFIKEKAPESVVGYDTAKQNIFARVMKDKEQALLIEFFEKRKSEATVKVIRKP